MKNSPNKDCKSHKQSCLKFSLLDRDSIKFIGFKQRLLKQERQKIELKVRNIIKNKRICKNFKFGDL